MMGAIVGLMTGAIAGLMGAVGSLGALCSMGDANGWRWPGGLMESKPRAHDRLNGSRHRLNGSH
jgi:hypothetical protein